MRSAKKRIEQTARGMGAALFGVADMKVVLDREPDALTRIGPGFTRAVVSGVRLQRAVLNMLTDGPSPLYFHNYRQANYQLDTLALTIADWIQGQGYRAIAIPASQMIQREPMLGHISHRLMGWAAGLGFQGRNNLLVSPIYGSQVRYVTVLTDMPLPSDKPVDADCGSCRACVGVCPAHAIATDPKAFDLDACYAKLCEFVRRPFIGQHICGLCLKACSGSGVRSVSEKRRTLKTERTSRGKHRAG